MTNHNTIRMIKIEPIAEAVIDALQDIGRLNPPAHESEIEQMFDAVEGAIEKAIKEQNG